MLEGRTKEGPVLVFGWFQANGQVKFLCITGNGTTKAIPMDQVSIDWHYDEQRGFVRDFENEPED